MIYHVHKHNYDRYGTSGTLDDIEPVVRMATKAIRPHLDEFDSIVVTGLSGVVIGVPVAMRLKKPLVIVRKSGDDSHSGSHVNAKRLGSRALFLDDFISLGETFDRVAEAVVKEKATVVAQYLYRDEEYLRLSS